MRLSLKKATGTRRCISKTVTDALAPINSSGSIGSGSMGSIGSGSSGPIGPINSSGAITVDLWAPSAAPSSALHRFIHQLQRPHQPHPLHQLHRLQRPHRLHRLQQQPHRLDRLHRPHRLHRLQRYIYFCLHVALCCAERFGIVASIWQMCVKTISF